MNKQEIIDQAMQLAAGIGNDPLTSAVIDADMTAEDLLPHAFRHAYRNMLETGGISLQDVMIEHFIELDTNETAALPAGVLNEYLDSAFLPDFPYSSFSRYFSDFSRDRFDNLLCYFTTNNGSIYSSCDPIIPVKTVGGMSLALNSPLITTTDITLAAADVARRMRVVVSGVTKIDVVIDAYLTPSTVNARGHAAALLNSAVGNVGTIYSTAHDQLVRSLAGVNTTADSATVTCAGGAFTSVDVGRRYHIVDGVTQILDAYIASVTNGTTVVMTAKALSTTAIGTADILYSPLRLHAPSIPGIPANPATDIAMPERARDVVVMTLAMALRGEIKFSM